MEIVYRNKQGNWGTLFSAEVSYLKYIPMVFTTLISMKLVSVINMRSKNFPLYIACVEFIFYVQELKILLSNGAVLFET